MNERRWYEWSLSEVILCVCLLTVLYWIFGPPTTVVGWLAIGPGLFIGSAIHHVIRKLRSRA